METNMFMAVSINGYIADENLSEDFLSEQNWNTFSEMLEEYGHVIYGRTTYENVSTWDNEHLKVFKDKIIIVISNRDLENKPDNVFVCKGPFEAIELLKEKGYAKALVSGGSQINRLFLENNLIDNIILNYNPVIITKGVHLFYDNYNIQANLETKSVKELDNGIVQIGYKVVK